MIRLITFFENDLGIRIEDEEILADNFSTPRQIARLLAEKAAKSNSEFAIPGAKGHQA
jgi:acyl carrier protein